MRQSLPMFLIRVIVGLVFLTEGILKFVRPDELGSGRFAAIGLPYPQVLAPLAGGTEIVAGAAVLLNLYAGDAAILLLAVIFTALVNTKLPICWDGRWAVFAGQAAPLRLAELSPRGAAQHLHVLCLNSCTHRLRPARRTQNALVSIQKAVVLNVPAGESALPALTPAAARGKGSKSAGRCRRSRESTRKDRRVRRESELAEK